jgi:membrane protein DedA with SNARE-associated domain
MRPLPLLLAVALTVVLVLQGARMGWTLRVLGVLAAGGFAVYGSGVVDPPDLEALLLDVGEALGDWTYVLVGGLAFLETGAFVGLVAPGETAVIAGDAADPDVVPLLALVWVCCIAGDTVSFMLGRKLGRGFMVRHGPKVKITEERLEQVERFFERRGGLTILLGRFLGFVRALAPFVAGASRMSYGRFLPYDVVGCGLWSTTFVLLGYVSWRNIDRAAEWASRGSLVLGALIVAGVAFVVLRRTDAGQRRRGLRWVRDRAVARPRHNERPR